MQEIISRRNFLKGTAVGAGALAVGAGGASLLTAAGKAYAAKKPPPPPEPIGYLPVVPLDIEQVRKLAWKHYFQSGG